MFPGALVATAWVLVHEALARTRAQAERVVVWIDRMTSLDPPARDMGLFLYIRNDSASPVVRVRVEYTTGSMELPVIAPGKEVHLGLDKVVSGAVEFTDAAGRRWRRLTGGGPPRRMWRGASSR
jgi:hypothetical protein